MKNSKLISNQLSIIVPAYNETKTIHLILEKIKNVTLLNEINKEIRIPGLGNIADSILNLLGYQKPAEFLPSLISFNT